jgi:hypothetical protein
VKNNSRRRRRRSSSACIEAWWWGFMAIFGKLFFDVSSVSRQRNLWTWSPSFSVQSCEISFHLLPSWH